MKSHRACEGGYLQTTCESRTDRTTLPAKTTWSDEQAPKIVPQSLWCFVTVTRQSSFLQSRWLLQVRHCKTGGQYKPEQREKNGNVAIVAKPALSCIEKRSKKNRGSGHEGDEEGKGMPPPCAGHRGSSVHHQRRRAEQSQQSPDAVTIFVTATIVGLLLFRLEHLKRSFVWKYA